MPELEPPGMAGIVVQLARARHREARMVSCVLPHRPAAIAVTGDHVRLEAQLLARRHQLLGLLPGAERTARHEIWHGHKVGTERDTDRRFSMMIRSTIATERHGRPAFRMEPAAFFA